MDHIKVSWPFGESEYGPRYITPIGVLMVLAPNFIGVLARQRQYRNGRRGFFFLHIKPCLWNVMAFKKCMKLFTIGVEIKKRLYSFYLWNSLYILRALAYYFSFIKIHDFSVRRPIFETYITFFYNLISLN
jgi:hypothetical protein